MKKILLLCSLIIFFITGCNNKNEYEDAPSVLLLDFYATDTIETKTNMEYIDGVVVNEEQIDHYVKPNSQFYLHVKLDNPNSYEILSITINDTKYQSFNFEKFSNFNEIIIQFTSKNPGIEYYQIMQIKYVENETIKDVNVDLATAIIKVGVSQVDIPSIHVEVTKQLYTILLNFKIIDNLIYNAVYRFILLKDEQIIDMKDLANIDTSCAFGNLEEGKTYNLMVICYADLLDGNGVSAVTIYNEEIQSYSKIEIKNLEIYPDKVNYDLEFNIVPLSYKVILNDEVDVTGLSEISQLDPNKTYKLTIIYREFNVDFEQKVDYYFTTSSYETPYVLNFNTSINKNDISYEILLYEAYSRIVETKMELFDQNNNLINTSFNLKDTFDNLECNSLYKFVFSYTYIIDDVQTTSSQTKFVMTSPLQKPDFNPIIVTFEDYIYCSYETYDIDNVIKSVNIYMLSSINQETPLSDKYNCFSGLEENSYYDILYRVYYDYNDGLGIREAVYTYHVKTKNELNKIYYQLDLQEDKTTLTIDNINYVNNPSLKINYIELREAQDVDTPGDIIKTYQVIDNQVVLKNLESQKQYFILIYYSYNCYNQLGIYNTKYSDSFIIN